MRVPFAAVAAALAMLAGGPVGVRPRTSPTAWRNCFTRLEQVIQRGDAAEYNQLLALSANRARRDAFARSALRPDVTRAVVHERERIEIAGALPGDAYRLVVDVFEEREDRARISTWRLDVTRRDAPEGIEWAITDQDEISSVNDLYRLSLDSTRSDTRRPT